jgi:hypothetical protein
MQYPRDSINAEIAEKPAMGSPPMMTMMMTTTDRQR